MTKERIQIVAISQRMIDEHLEVVFSLRIKRNEYNLIYNIGGGVKEVPLLADAAVVTFVPYAIKHGLDIYSEYPISTQLYYNLKKHVIPQLSIFSKTKSKKISIEMPLSYAKYEGKWVGTGISLGVDSFATVHEYYEDSIAEDYRINRLVHLKTGAHHGSLGYFDKKAEQRLFDAEHERVKDYCESNNYHLVTVETNLFEITNAEFGWNFDTTHTFRNLACIILMQNYFSKYYYASTYNLDGFSVSLDSDAAHYEKWLLPHISNDSISFYSANEDMSRVEKTKYITKFKDTYDWLHVCWGDKKNCGSCPKCVRTLVTLDLLGELDKYKNSFDLDKYRKERDYYICKVVANRKRDAFYGEIYAYMKVNDVKIPPFLKVAAEFIKHGAKVFKSFGIKGFYRIVKERIFG